MSSFKFKRINNTSIVQNVIDQLTEAMIKGNIKPGDKIPTELELSESFGVGRNSIREAIKILVAFGVLEIRRPEGTFVCQGFSQQMINPFLYGIILNQGDSYKSLKEFRKTVEEGIIKLCIRNHDESDFKIIEDIYLKLISAIKNKSTDVDQVFKLDDEFHKAIASATHNMLMQSINDLLRILTTAKRYETTIHLLDNETDYFINSHKSIYDAIKAKDESSLNTLVPDNYFIDY